MRARDAELVDRHDPVRPGRSDDATAGERQALDAVRDDPAIDDAEPARRRVAAPVAGPTGAVPEVGVAGDDRVLGVEHERAGRIDPLGEEALDPPVRLERAVPVEVVAT